MLNFQEIRYISCGNKKFYVVIQCSLQKVYDTGSFKTEAYSNHNIRPQKWIKSSK